jgi:ABC-2 type transport system permease protein
MTAQLHAELLKLRTTRTFLALVAVTALTSVAIVTLICLLTEPTRASVVTDVYTADTTSLFILVLAIVGITGEWRHRTIAGALLAAPDRVRFLAAKTIAYVAAGLLLSLAVSACVALIATGLLTFRDLPLPGLGDVVVQIARNMAVAAVFGALGVALGGLVRNQVVAIVGALVCLFALEPAVMALAPHVGRYGPFDALPGAIQHLRPEDIGLAAGTTTVAVGLAALLMLAWIAVLWAPAAALLRRRDVN